MLRILLFAALLIISCEGNQNTTIMSPISVNTRAKDSVKTVYVTPVLLRELKAMIDETEKYPESFFKNKIYEITFSKLGKDCFLTIYRTTYYQSYRLKGYFLINGKAVIFYNPNNECNCGIVDTNSLIKSVPKDFSDENSEDARSHYDPISKKFKIHGKDSIELVEEGMM